MNDWQPVPTVIEKITPLLADHRLFVLRPATPMALAPGQFVEVGIAGVGSFPVSSCDLVRDGCIHSCIRRAGRVTEALFQLREGAVVGLRGPFGNGFPLTSYLGRDALLIAGGLGMAPLRGVLQALLADPRREGKIIVLYGSREPEALLFFDELVELARLGRISVRFSVDFAESLPGPYERVFCKIGLVTELLEDLDFAPRRTVAAVCGPPALYHCVLEELALMGVSPANIHATLERRMRCGVGVCCHCVAGDRYVCRDGPVFSLEQLRRMAGAL